MSEGALGVDQEARSPRLLRAASLRTRLVVGVVSLSLCGLVIADVVIYNRTSSYLVAQLGQELQSRSAAVAHALESPNFAGSTNQRLYELGLPVGTFGELLDSAGNSSSTPFQVVGTSGNADPPPVLPSALPGSNSNPSGNAETVSENSHPAGMRYLVLASPLLQGGTLILAFPLTDVDGTLGQLELIELVVTAGVALAVALVSLIVVRIGLRPLGAIELTAAAIAEGDLTRRVRRDDDKTEVGRLGRSVNAMLARIERAFAERTISENRLRRFVSDASHELRTPITAIRGYAELYRRGAISDPEAVAGAMKRIEGEAERIGVLVEELLLLARLDQGRPLEQQPVDLAQVATEVTADAGVVHPMRPMTVEAPEKLVVEGDEGRLRQVLINLVQNAMVHTPEEAPVTVRVRQDGDLAVVEVEDQGPGIEPEHLSHIFERFYRADSSRARETGGAGLGLSIVASIAEAHGGRASVSSEIGRGSTFRVEIPIASRVPAVGTSS